MSEQRQPDVEQIEERERQQWVRPAVTQFRAGEAEASDINTTDGAFIS